MTTSLSVDSTSQPGAETRWAWDRGEQPVFSPRRALIPTPVHARLANAPQDLVLGWFHRYPARFAADVVTTMLAEAITRARRPVRSILDPFCGTGTVISACHQLGLTARGVELTQLGVEISRLRLHPPANPWDAAAFCQRLAQSRPATHARLDEQLIQWIGQDNAHGRFKIVM